MEILNDSICINNWFPNFISQFSSYENKTIPVSVKNNSINKIELLIKSTKLNEISHKLLSIFNDNIASVKIVADFDFTMVS